MDRTLILVKPDAFARGLTGEIIARFERKGLRIAALKHMQMDRDLASCPSRTIATSGPLVMNETSSSKKGLPSCSA